MKLSRKQLRYIINEEILRGVPEFILREETSKFINNIKKHIYKNVLVTKNSAIAEQEEIESVDEMLKILENNINDMLDETLWKYHEINN